ncbi:hypothetical protein V144x_07210 [Gimesia aquarii]|uniref:Uncharacterized protein n=1 Tax=Gimesia aquarii TaxID=2527964 RepID=A0A517VQQ1_9PLAN|nr:hypothetical protein V144x_07210 [Gimesia aquarii]
MILPDSLVQPLFDGLIDIYRLPANYSPSFKQACTQTPEMPHLRRCGRNDTKTAISLQGSYLSVFAALKFCPDTADKTYVPFDFSFKWDIIASSGSKYKEST